MIPTLDASTASIALGPPIPPVHDRKGKSKAPAPWIDAGGDQLYYRTYWSEEEDLEEMMRLVEQELSEPYVSPH